MIDNSSLNDQYDFASFSMLSLLFGHPCIIQSVIFFSSGSFAVSSLIFSNLDFVAGAFSYTICGWAVSSSNLLKSFLTVMSSFSVWSPWACTFLTYSIVLNISLPHSSIKNRNTLYFSSSVFCLIITVMFHLHFFHLVARFDELKSILFFSSLKLRIWSGWIVFLCC